MSTYLSLNLLLSLCFSFCLHLFSLSLWLSNTFSTYVSVTPSLCSLSISVFLLARPSQDVFLLPLIPWIEQGGGKPTCYITLWSVWWLRDFKLHYSYNCPNLSVTPSLCSLSLCSLSLYGLSFCSLSLYGLSFCSLSFYFLSHLTRYLPPRPGTDPINKISHVKLFVLCWLLVLSALIDCSNSSQSNHSKSR